MASVIDNLNSLINTKSQLNTILQENGQEGGDVFSEYPEQFRAIIDGLKAQIEEQQEEQR